MAEVRYEGSDKPETVRLFTSLLDVTACPALELPRVFAGRLEEELFFHELKSHLNRRSNSLDGQTRETCVQEVMAMLLAASLIAKQREAVAGMAGVAVTSISFAKVYAETRSLFEQARRSLLEQSLL